MQSPEVPQPQPATQLSPLPNTAMREGKNGGKLLTGNPGNRGGPGAVPSVVRQEAREGLRRAIPRLVAIAEGERVTQSVVAVGADGKVVAGEAEVIAKVADQVGAAKVLAQVGMGPPIAADDLRARIIQQCGVLREELGAEIAERVIERLSAEVWK